MGKTTVRQIVLETCDAIWKLLSKIYVTEPNEWEYRQIADEYNNRWNMPNCLGAMDGKHIYIQCPPKSHTMYFNYKKRFSIVLFAVCDDKYTFTNVCLGAYGSQSDGGIYDELLPLLHRYIYNLKNCYFQAFSPKHNLAKDYAMGNYLYQMKRYCLKVPK